MKQVIVFMFSIGGFICLLCVTSILTKVLTEAIHYRGRKDLAVTEKIWNFFVICLIVSLWIVFGVSIKGFIEYCLTWR